MTDGFGLLLGAHPMIEKLQLSVPEIILFVAAVIVMVIGLSPRVQLRQLCGWVAGIALLAAAFAALLSPDSPNALLPDLIPFGKTLIAVIGVLLVMLVGGAADREYEAAVARGRVFDGIRSTRGEFYAFFLFSMMGLMLCTSADDLIWIFLALELTSLPTYVMVSISTSRSKSQEAGVKYFFLGAFGAAMFLYGFALLYGATGSTLLVDIAASFDSGINPMGMLGLIMALVGVSFKIAAVPMHFYTPDVYEGAATSVSAFLAFVPKAAGFFVLILLLATVGWTHGADENALPDAVRVTLWLMAAATMTVGNVMALLQTNVKRILAYSSIAHSGYMLVGLLAGPGGGAATNGLGAVLFYLMCYGFMNLGAFAVLACLERRPGMEVEDVDDLRGLCRRQPLLGGVMVLCSLSMLGLPPLLGLWGKLYLFTSAISAGEIAIVVIMGINSAIAAFYYLRLMAYPMLEDPTERSAELKVTPFAGRIIAGAISAASVVLLVIPADALLQRCNDAAQLGDVARRAIAEAERNEQPPAPVASDDRVADADRPR